MKNKMQFILISIPLIMLFGCNGQNDRSDAWGNFEATEVTISAQSGGELMAFGLNEGDFLRKGTVVGWIDTTDLVLKKQQLISQKAAVNSKIPSFEAQAAVYQQQKKNAGRDMERFEAMHREGAATQKQLDDISGQIQVIEKQIASVEVQKSAVHSEIQAIEKQIAQVEEAISKAVITQPGDGSVLTKYVNAHEMVMAGKPLYKYADLRQMKLKVYVSGAQLPDIHIGQQAEVLIDKNETENRKLTGKVSWISESAEFTPKIIQTKEERVNLVYAVKMLVPNDGSLKIGMPGEVIFVQDQNESPSDK